MDYRVVFLVFVLITFFLYRMRTSVSFLGFINKETILSLLMAASVIGTIISFIALMTDQNPLPLFREIGYQVGMREMVSFSDAVPDYLAEDMNVNSIARVDFDEDGFQEWLVFYNFDFRSEKTPIKAIVYDNDRGNPPTIYPYALRAPNDHYLSEGEYTYEFDQVVEQQNGPNGEDLQEFLVWGYPNVPLGLAFGTNATNLTIFRYQAQPGDVWTAPTDNPPRFPAVGAFHVEGDIDFDVNTKQVTTIERGGLERGQLATRKIYELREMSYMDPNNPNTLLPPIATTLDFYPAPPNNIESASFPEVIVLAFYASMCGGDSITLCHRYDNTYSSWSPDQFLAQESPALNEYDNGNSDYFGLPSVGFSVLDFSISNLQPSMLQNDVNLVDITFSANDNAPQTVRYRTVYSDGKWKITERVELEAAILGGN